MKLLPEVLCRMLLAAAGGLLIFYIVHQTAAAIGGIAGALEAVR